MDRRIIPFAMFSLSLLRWVSADRLGTVTLYGGSSISACGETEEIADGGSGELSLIGNYSDLRYALEELESGDGQFSHFTVCLSGGASRAYELSPVNITSSVAIISAGSRGTEKSKVYCSAEPSETGYAAFFYGSEDVRLENLHFEGCGLPIGFELVQNIIISHCSFQ